MLHILIKSFKLKNIFIILLLLSTWHYHNFIEIKVPSSMYKFGVNKFVFNTYSFQMRSETAVKQEIIA